MREIFKRLERLQLLVVFVVANACVAADEAPDATGCALDEAPVATAEQALFGGDPACAVLGAWQEGVGALLVRSSFEDNVLIGTCTATRLAAGVALTAKHCFPTSNHFRASIGFAPIVQDASGCARGSAESLIEQVTFHPTKDLAIVLYGEIRGGPAIAIATSRPTVSSAVVMAGYGLTEQNTLHERRCLTSTVQSVNEVLLTQGASGDQGACVGDSGGPLIQLAAGGPPELLGVLSSGSASCKGVDRYVVLAAERKWVETAVSDLDE